MFIAARIAYIPFLYDFHTFPDMNQCSFRIHAFGVAAVVSNVFLWISLRHFRTQLAKTDPLAHATHLTAEWWKSNLINLVKYAKEIRVRALAWFVINSLKMFCPPCSEVFVFLIQLTDKHLCIEMNYNHTEFWPFLLKKKKTLKTAKIVDENKP